MKLLNISTNITTNPFRIQDFKCEKILKDLENYRHDFKKKMERKENPNKYSEIAVKELLYLCSKKLHFTFNSNIYI